MVGYNRIEALKRAIHDGFVANAMISADVFLTKGKITQVEFDDLEALAYPIEDLVSEIEDSM